MCAATALPLRLRNVSVHRITRVEASSVTVALNTPRAFAGALGFGTSAATVIAAL